MAGVEYSNGGSATIGTSISKGFTGVPWCSGGIGGIRGESSDDPAGLLAAAATAAAAAVPRKGGPWEWWAWWDWWAWRDVAPRS